MCNWTRTFFTYSTQRTRTFFCLLHNGTRAFFGILHDGTRTFFGLLHNGTRTFLPTPQWDKSFFASLISHFPVPLSNKFCPVPNWWGSFSFFSNFLPPISFIMTPIFYKKCATCQPPFLLGTFSLFHQHFESLTLVRWTKLWQTGFIHIVSSSFVAPPPKKINK